MSGIQIYASIQRTINMIREATHNTIGHLKDILTENNKIVERNKNMLFQAQQNTVQDALNMVSKLTWIKSDISLKTLEIC